MTKDQDVRNCHRQGHTGNIKPLFRLKFLLGLLFWITPFVAGANTLSDKIDITVKEISFENLIREIKTKTTADFLYNIRETTNVGKISLNLKNADVDEILNVALKGKSLTFSKVNGVYVIVPSSPVSQKDNNPKRFTIKGKVVNAKGETMPGVTVRLDSTNLGTATDGKGIFLLNLPVERGALVFSFVGYKTKKNNFKYQPDRDIIVTLEEEVSALDEVTVVAYGEVSKREMTGAVSVIKADDIKGIPSTNIGNLLQGRVAGMDVTNVSGAPGGGGTQITLRGYNSLSIESGRRFSNPLWVVDGVPMTTFTSPVTGTNGLSDLNPETIETIQILKDASATSLYGSRAANGVIIVTTKKGKKNQEAQFDVNFSYTYSILPAYPTVYGGRGERAFRLKALMNARTAYYDEGTNTYRYPTSYEDAWAKGQGGYDHFWGTGKTGNENGNVMQDSLNPFYDNSTDFFKYYFQAGKVLNANIQTHGGSEYMTYSVGLGYYKEDGILKGTGYKRANLMGNFTLTPIPRMTLDFRTSLSYSDRSRGLKDGGYSSGNEIETIPGDPLELSSLMPGNGAVLDKALEGLQGTQEKNKTYRLRNSFGLNFDIIKGLKLSSTLSLDYAQDNRNFFQPSWLDERGESKSTGEISRNSMLLNENLLTFRKEMGKHIVDAMLGFSYQLDQNNYISGYGMNGPSDMVHYVTSQGWPNYTTRENGDIHVYKDYQSNLEDKKMISYFGRLNYNYAQKYMLTATLRRDGSSVFGRNVRWAIFPSAALAWNFSEETFMDWASWLDFGKFRMSWGKSGNQFTSAYLAYGVLQGDASYKGQPSIAPNWINGYYNPDLSWEETSQYDLGLDLNMLDYRLSFTIDYYYRYTDKMLYEISIPGSHSGYNKMWSNAAGISNEGLEFEVKYDIFRGENLGWNISLNIAKNWNKFRESYNNEDLKTKGSFYILGKPLGMIYGYKTDGFLQTENDIVRYYNQSGDYQAIARPYSQNAFFVPGDVRFRDIDGDMSIDSDYAYLGSSLPTIYGGIVNEVHFKNFDMNLLFSYSLGRDMVCMSRVSSLSTIGNMKPIFEDLDNVTFWEKPGDNTDYPRIAMDNYNGNWGTIQDRNVEKVNYLKLKTMTVGYTLPKLWVKKVGLKDIRVFFSGENLLTWTNYSGLDPETVDMNTGLDDGRTYPLARKLTLGITIKL